MSELLRGPEKRRKPDATMELFIPKIALETLTETERERYAALDQTPYGESIARAVAGKLSENPTEGGGLYFAHRDYCGMGLYKLEEKFILGTVNDARGPYPVVATFGSEAAFADWLADQSDRSMALYGEKFDNQTITRLRLEWYLEDAYSAVWNVYCNYVRERNNLEPPVAVIQG